MTDEPNAPGLDPGPDGPSIDDDYPELHADVADDEHVVDEVQVKRLAKIVNRHPKVDSVEYAVGDRAQLYVHFTVNSVPEGFTELFGLDLVGARATFEREVSLLDPVNPLLVGTFEVDADALDIRYHESTAADAGDTL